MGSLGPSPARSAGLGFCVVRGAVMRDVRVRRRGFGRRVMPERKFVGVGMTGKARRVMPEGEFVE